MTKVSTMHVMRTSRVASHWRAHGSEGGVQCMLCPRHCKLRPGETGFCGVRGNVGSEQHTFNYGYGLPPAIEAIESEAVYHYRPGARVLCVGNIGCMLNCDFCQNWQTSQISCLDWKHTSQYTPKEIVELALANDIGIISWTYNDPVVWQEFVLETAHMASRKNILNLYKSALYIELSPLRELIEVIDIFSISLKAMSPAFYQKYTHGSLTPVLDGIRELGRHPDKHIEISQLVVTGLNDDGTDARITSSWLAETLGTHIPMHFVAFHPAYKYTNVTRTPLEKLVQLRDIALGMGMEHVYIGNTYAPDVSDTRCSSCGHTLIERYGLATRVVGLDEQGRCVHCSQSSTIIEPLYNQENRSEANAMVPMQEHLHEWIDDSSGIHIACSGNGTDSIHLRVQRLPSNDIEHYNMGRGLGRITINKRDAFETGLRIEADIPEKLDIYPLLDRAHYPVI